MEEEKIRADVHDANKDRTIDETLIAVALSRLIKPHKNYPSIAHRKNTLSVDNSVPLSRLFTLLSSPFVLQEVTSRV